MKLDNFMEEFGELIEKHWNLVKDNVGTDGLAYKDRWTREEHIDICKKFGKGYLKGVIHGIENGYQWHPA